MKNLKNQPPKEKDTTVKEVSEISLGIIYRAITAATYECHAPTKLNYFLLILSEGGGHSNQMTPFQMQLFFPGQELHCKLEATCIFRRN